MKTIFIILLILGVITHTINAECSMTEKCPSGQACVKKGGAMKCMKYASKGQPCSECDGDPQDVPVFNTNPPCDPSQNLECTEKGNREVCTKQ